MYNVRILTDVNECRAAWEEVIPRKTIWDLWEMRECFHRHYQRPLLFITAEEAGRIRGLLPLSWMAESVSYGYFPGEAWEGQTWLEQNRIYDDDNGSWSTLLGSCPGSYHLRYLQLPDTGLPAGTSVDEIGYFFIPPQYKYEMENYFGEFSRNSRKRLRRDLSAFDEYGVRYRFDEPADFEHLVKMNLDRFGDASYFSDSRFNQSFRDLMNLLRARGWMRLTTVLIKGEVAAVDLGCIFNGVYTLLAGGTHSDFPGVAKLINIYHMRWACEQKLDLVEFLCGGFSWKTLFHLTPRPLYLLTNRASPEQMPITAGSGRDNHAG